MYNKNIKMSFLLEKKYPNVYFDVLVPFIYIHILIHNDNILKV